MRRVGTKHAATKIQTGETQKYKTNTINMNKFILTIQTIFIRLHMTVDFHIRIFNAPVKI